MRSHPPSIWSSLVLLIATAAVGASACTCGISPNFSYAEHRLSYDYVFHGEVSARGQDLEKNRNWMSFRVIRDFTISQLGERTVTVWSSISGASCGVFYPIGRQVLIFARADSDTSGLPAGNLYTGLCSMNAEPPYLDSAVQEMEGGVGVREPARSPWAAGRKDGALVEDGQVILGGKVRANGAIRKTAGKRSAAGDR